MNVTAAEALIRERISASPTRMISWCDVMQLALYEPGIGYYRKGVRRIGRGGDFFTSVSVGPVFGELLTIYCAQVWEALDRPADFAIIEQGANDGTLARDILETAARDHTELFASMQYWIVEPDSETRRVQKSVVGEKYADHIRHVASQLDLKDEPKHALFLCNELHDAFPVHRIRFDGARWLEQHVCLAEDGHLDFVDAPIFDPALILETDKIGADFPSGYTTELNLEMLRWMRNVADSEFRGSILILDYGLPANELFSESRYEGTLRRYHQHHSDDRVLESLGECDLTAHVNFTRLAQEAQSCGLGMTEFIEQGRFLTKLASWKIKNPTTHLKPDWIRQFQTLTHPSHLGMSFHALALKKGKSLGADSIDENQTAARCRLGL